MSPTESSIINGDSALPIPRQLARWIGLNEAAILQQLHYHTLQEHGQKIAGVRWVRMSETEWMEEIPLDEKAIQRAIKNLVEDELIQSATFSGHGRSKWYTINYSAVDSLDGPVDRIVQKSEKRKQARASRKDVKEQIVPIVIDPIDNDEYAKVKEQSVPIDDNEPQKEQSVPIEWEQNVLLQDSSFQDQDSLILNAHAREEKEILERIGVLSRTNFSNPNIEPFRTSLITACHKYTSQKVLWAMEVALSPEKANGRPKTWGYVLGILEKDKEETYQPRKVSRNNGHKPAKDHRPDIEKRGGKNYTAEEWNAMLRGDAGMVRP